MSTYLKPPPYRLGCTLLLSSLLVGCNVDIPGLGPDPRTVARQAEAKAVGGACRHAMRGLEDCYVLNPKSSKALIFAGWKDMDEYMRSNKVEGVPSVLGQNEQPRGEKQDTDESSNRS
ncbi:hypothetical protein [Comamonas composti]|uniref:hypothetical protein n=1 Tax=Comamonas composti TaxID=408558 RepID=UPI000556DF56|nr:hypothetical protein [Comamonas composti]